MNSCKQTQALLFEKVDGRIDGAERTEMDAHLAVCPHCKQVFAAWTAALPRLRGLAPDEPSAVSARRMENEVLRQLCGTVAPRTRRIGWFALAAGLVLVALGGLYSLRALSPQPFARIQTMWGQVTLAGVALTKGAAIGSGGMLEIAAEGEAAFQVGRAAEVQLFGPGRVAFDGTVQSPRLRLDSGRLAVQIAHRRSGEGFAVTTTHGRIEVRGTRFVVGYAEQGSYVHVDEGEVAAFRAGDATPFGVKAGETFWLKAEILRESPAAPALAPTSVGTEPRSCPASTCSEAAARARKAMRAGNPARAVDLIEEALGRAADCSSGWSREESAGLAGRGPTRAASRSEEAAEQTASAAGWKTAGGFPSQRCLAEIGYLRAEALRQAGRLEAAVSAFRSLSRPSATRAMSQNALYAAGQLERQLGRKADARQSFERAYAAYPDGALAEEAMAALLDLAGPRFAEARTTAERYLARYPQGMAAARARRILSGATGSR